eukprot:TRINITY_DN20951_c0_g1_i4.p1 TRINITY_DN20951_c0_g1~~TRINITY_DN20951_c0_g1_i4.p1  ORF type:complete len:407 (-),score=153.10 TRINITY_DN20951_c0_g1_i4:51-1271(-)
MCEKRRLAMQAELDAARAEHAECAEAKRRVEVALQSLERQHAQCGKKVQQPKADHTACNAKISLLEERANKAEAENRACARKIQQLEASLSMLQAEHAPCAEEISRLRAAGGGGVCVECPVLALECRQQRERGDELEGMLEELQREHEACPAAIKRLQDYIDRLKAQPSNSTDVGSGLAKELSAAVFILDPAGRVLYSSAGGQIFLGRCDTRDMSSNLLKGGPEVAEAVRLAMEFDEITCGIGVENADGVKMYWNVWKTEHGQIEVIQDIEATVCGKYRWVQEDPHKHQVWHTVGKGTTHLLEEVIGNGESSATSPDGKLLYSPHTRLAIEVASGKNHKMKRQRRLRGWEAIPSSMDKPYKLEDLSPRNSSPRSSGPVINKDKIAFVKPKAGKGSKVTKPKPTARR